MGKDVVFSGCIQPLATCCGKKEFMCCKFNASGDLITAGGTDGSITVFKSQTGVPVYQLPSPDPRHLPVTATCFPTPPSSPASTEKNMLLASYSAGYVCHWHVSTGQQLNTIVEKRQTMAVASGPDGLTFASTGSDAKVLVYDGITMDLLYTLEPSMSQSVMDGHMSRVFALCFHPSDPRILLSAGWDDTVQFWDTREEHSVRKISGPHVCADALDIDPTTLNIVTASWRYNDSIQVWDFDSGKLVSTVKPDHKTKWYGARWMEKGVLFAGGILDSKVAVINTNNGLVLGGATGLERGVYCVDYHRACGTLGFVEGTKLHVGGVPNKASTFITKEEF